MKYVHNIFNEQLELDENKANVLIIENKDFFKEIVLDILNLVDRKESKSWFFEDHTELKKGMDIVTDIFNLDINSTKNLTKLYGKIKEEYITGENYEKYMKLCTEVHSFLTDVVETFEFGLEYNENLDLSSFMKLNSVKFSFDDKSVLEKMMDYIQILHDYIEIKVFVFVNIKSYLGYDEVVDFYKYIELNKINVLFIETTDYTEYRHLEKIKIIDQDLCVIN